MHAMREREEKGGDLDRDAFIHVHQIHGVFQENNGFSII